MAERKPVATKRAASRKKPGSPAKAPKRKPAADRAEVFIRQYMIHKNKARAYREAGFDTSPSADRQNAHNLFTSHYVQQRLTEEREKHLAALDVTVGTVFQRFKDIAFADAAQITAYEVGACRYCNGTNHQFQWRTPREYEAALNEAILESDSTGKRVPLPGNGGGYGYSTNLAPHPDCPECDGAGIPRVRFKDTRLLTDAERALFAGVEQTQHGIKYKFKDQDDALKQLAEHLQFFKERDESNANAVARLLHDLQARGQIGQMPLRRDVEPEA